MEAAGIEPSSITHFKSNTSETEAIQIAAKSSHINTLQEEPACSEKQKSTLPQHQKDTSAHEKCATCVQQQLLALPEDLAEIVAAWVHIPDAVKAGILAMIRAVR